LHAAELGYAYQETDVCFFGDDIGLRFTMAIYDSGETEPLIGRYGNARNLLKLDDLLDTLLTHDFLSIRNTPCR